MRQLYLMRHGQTELNAQHIVQGSAIDAPLNATGHEQARRFFEFHKHTPFRAVFSSTMQRARQTVAPFASLGLPMHAHDQLREFHWGVYEGKPYNESLKLEVNDLVAAWERGETHLPISGGESPDQALARMLNAMDEIFATYPDGNLLICTHGRVLRILLAHWLAGGPDRMQQFPHYNTGLNILRHTPQGFVAERLCDISHLEGMEG